MDGWMDRCTCSKCMHHYVNAIADATAVVLRRGRCALQSLEKYLHGPMKAKHVTDEIIDQRAAELAKAHHDSQKVPRIFDSPVLTTCTVHVRYILGKLKACSNETSW